ncbi:hypothetical protein Tco_0494048 [Tanacetum coccineum]
MKNRAFITLKSERVMAAYNGALVKKYGSDSANHPIYDNDLWKQCAAMPEMIRKVECLGGRSWRVKGRIEEEMKVDLKEEICEELKEEMREELKEEMHAEIQDMLVDYVSSDSSEGSKNSKSFEDSGRSDEEYPEYGAFSKEGGSKTPQIRRSIRESRAPVSGRRLLPDVFLSQNISKKEGITKIVDVQGASSVEKGKEKE